MVSGARFTQHEKQNKKYKEMKKNGICIRCKKKNDNPKNSPYCKLCFDIKKKRKLQLKQEGESDNINKTSLEGKDGN